ncbi:MAG: hypothetical protein M3271_11395 [Actinomycetota bacterium]|nr:hypothetical protein [Actinomycetota bacterium]
MTRTLLLISALGALVACVDEPSTRADDPPAAETSFGEDLSYSCGGVTFPVAAIEDRQSPSDDLLAAIEKLRKSRREGDIVPPDGWFMVAGTRDRATLLAPLGDKFAYATFEKKGQGWDVPAWARNCVPRLHVPGKSVLRWAFREGAYPPDSGATELNLLVIEDECSSARDIEGLIEANVEYREDRVDVVLTAPGLERGAYTCQGTPPTEYELVLSEPVGDREVIDLSVYPQVEPGTSLP